MIKKCMSGLIFISSVLGIEFKIRGQCRAEWREGFNDLEQQLFETEDYIRHTIVLFGKRIQILLNAIFNEIILIYMITVIHIY